MTLTAFVGENDKLLTALGVFTGLMIFAQALPLKGIAVMLSVIFFTLTVIVWFELWGKFPKKAAPNLGHFENLLAFGAMLMAFHLLVEVNKTVPAFIMTLVFMAVITPASLLIKKYDFFNRLAGTGPGGKRGLRYALALGIVGVSIMAAFGIAGVLTPPVSAFLAGGERFFSDPNIWREASGFPAPSLPPSQKP